MALKRLITKAAYDKLSDDLKKEYVEDGDNFVLDIDGYEDPAELKRAKDREAQARKDAEKRLREAQAKLDELDNDDARKRGDIETLEKSWREKNEALKSELEGKLSAKDAFIAKTLRTSAATELASKISKSPKIMLPHILDRLDVDMSGDEPKLVVKGTDGKPSVASLVDLEKEFVANKDFADILVGSKAMGGGAATGLDRRPGSAPLTNPNDNRPLSQLSGKELVQVLQDRKAAQE